MNLRSLALPCALAAGLAACAQPGVTDNTPPAPAAPASVNSSGPAGGPRAYATFTEAAATVQGGTFEGFAYAEKAGDAGLGAVTPTRGAVRITGFTGAGLGSTWAGLGVRVQGAPNGAVADLSDHRVVRIALSATAPTALRIRLVGPDAATLANGCYPVAVQNVGPEPRTYDLPFSAFAPEGYCGTLGKAVAVTLPSLTAIEVTAPTTDTAKRRDIDFQVGAISIVR